MTVCKCDRCEKIVPMEDKFTITSSAETHNGYGFMIERDLGIMGKLEFCDVCFNAFKRFVFGGEENV